jgi:hypothetical protein
MQKDLEYIIAAIKSNAESYRYKLEKARGLLMI